MRATGGMRVRVPHTPRGLHSNAGAQRKVSVREAPHAHRGGVWAVRVSVAAAAVCACGVNVIGMLSCKDGIKEGREEGEEAVVQDGRVRGRAGYDEAWVGCGFEAGRWAI